MASIGYKGASVYITNLPHRKSKALVYQAGTNAQVLAYFRSDVKANILSKFILNLVGANGIVMEEANE